MSRFAETEVQVGAAIMAGTACAALGALTRSIDNQRTAGWERFYAAQRNAQATVAAERAETEAYAAHVARTSAAEIAAFRARRAARRAA